MFPRSHPHIVFQTLLSRLCAVPKMFVKIFVSIFGLSKKKFTEKTAARLMNNWLLSITNNVIENRFDRRTALSPGSEPKLCLLTLHFRSVVETRRLYKTTVLDFVVSSSYSHQTTGCFLFMKNTQLRCQLKSCWQGIVTISS